MRNKSVELVTNPSSGYKISSVKVPLSVMYFLTKFDDVIQTGFWVIPKNTSLVCPFESGKSGKEGKKLQKAEYLQNKRELWIKKYFS